MTLPTPQSTPFLNIAATCIGTEALGPGWRAAVWVQGCRFRCPGCIAPDWQTLKVADLITPQDLAAKILDDPDITGLTISGGEPFLQAAGLAHLVRLLRSERDLDVISFSGYPLFRLETMHSAGVTALLSELDVLVDGPYSQRHNNGRGLRGSTNQTIHYLTDRLKGCDLENTPRQVDLHIGKSDIMMVGIPTPAIREALDGII
jgi:anaerobic ribonucleoside-triphosphate reductase activating protein